MQSLIHVCLQLVFLLGKTEIDLQHEETEWSLEGIPYLDCTPTIQTTISQMLASFLGLNSSTSLSYRTTVFVLFHFALGRWSIISVIN